MSKYNIYILKLRYISLVSFLLIYIPIFPQNDISIDSLEHALSIESGDLDRVKLFLELGNQYKNALPDTALFYYHRALELSKNINEKNLTAQCLIYIARADQNQGNYYNTIENCKKALEIAVELDNKPEMVNCYNIIGVAYGYIGLYEKASEYYLRSLKIAEELDDKYNIAGCYNNLGILFHDQGSYEKAIDYYIKSLELYQEVDNKPGIARCYNNIGTIYYNIGTSSEDPKEKIDKYNEVIEYLHKSLKIAEEIKDQRVVQSCYNNIGQAYEEIGALYEESSSKETIFNDAIEYYNKALEISTEIDDKNTSSYTYVSIASLNVKLSELDGLTSFERIDFLDNAIEFGNKSFKLADDINALPQKNLAASVLSQAYKKAGNCSQALDYFEIFNETKDNLFQEEKTRAIHEMTIKYETEKKQQEIILLNEENRTKQQKLRARNYLIFSLVLLFIIFIGITLQLRKNALQKMHQMENELQNYIMILKEYTNKDVAVSSYIQDKYGLSERESEILFHLSKGGTYATIAENIFVSRNTVKFHIKNIYLKLDVKNKIEALKKIEN